MREVAGERCHKKRIGLGPVRRFVDWIFWVANSYLFSGCPKWLPFRYSLNVAESFPGVSFDCVVARYPHEAAVARPWRYGRLFVDFDDNPLELYETLSAPRQSAVRRRLSRGVFRWTIGRVLEHCAGIWVSNPEQTGAFPSSTRVLPLENIPGEVPARYDPSAPRSPCLLIVGQMAWEPNRRGAWTFLSEVWPAVRARHPELILNIVGDGLSDSLRKRWESIPGVSCLGFVDDLHGLYARALAAVVPIDGGSGTCIKTREALAHARVCLSTPFGARGLSADDRRDGAAGVLVYRTAADFLSCLERVLDPTDRAELERQALDFARSKLSFPNFVSQVERMLGA